MKKHEHKPHVVFAVTCIDGESWHIENAMTTKELKELAIEINREVEKLTEKGETNDQTNFSH